MISNSIDLTTPLQLHKLKDKIVKIKCKKKKKTIS